MENYPRLAIAANRPDGPSPINLPTARESSSPPPRLGLFEEAEPEIGARFVRFGSKQSEENKNTGFSTVYIDPSDEDRIGVTYWQTCYACKAENGARDGSNHMTCACNAQFCMVCAAPWKTCNCTWFKFSSTGQDNNLPHHNAVNFGKTDDSPSPLSSRSFVTVKSSSSKPLNTTMIHGLGGNGKQKLTATIRKIKGVKITGERKQTPVRTMPLKRPFSYTISSDETKDDETRSRRKFMALGCQGPTSLDVVSQVPEWTMKRGLVPLRSRGLNGPMVIEDFSNFKFENMSVLEKAARDVATKLRAQEMQSQNTPVNSYHDRDGTQQEYNTSQMGVVVNDHKSYIHHGHPRYVTIHGEDVNANSPDQRKTEEQSEVRFSRLTSAIRPIVH
jgi:hypothetical protein